MPTFDVSSASPADARAEVLILPVFEGPKPGPGLEEAARALGVDLVRGLKDHGVTGKLGETFTVPTFGRLTAKSVLVVGLGPQRSADATAVRKAAMRAARRASRFATVASTLPRIGDSAQAFAEGLVLGGYRFDRYKGSSGGDSDGKTKLRTVSALSDAGDRRAIREALRRGQVYAEASNFARDLVNTPALDATPARLGEEAQAIAREHGLKSKIWTKAQLERGGFGGILGVGSGSRNEPRLIELEYRGAGGDVPIAISGKGVTFDSGGLSIKPADSMEWMKADMGGAAAALATMRAIGQLQPRLNVVAAIPSAENLPGGSAIRPGDVLRHRGGKTSEVLNTDAEGRLILADAIAYLSEKKPRAIIESATLTGAAMVALGTEIWVVLSNDDRLAADLLEAGRTEGEPGWQLPLWRDYRKNIDSTLADVKNTGGRYGGAINAGLFLHEFVAGGIPWAHLDVAGTAFVENANEYWPRGGTGSPARTLIRYLENQADGKSSGRRAGGGVTTRARSGRRSPARRP
jgi:leucyl aminopeptidase